VHGVEGLVAVLGFQDAVAGLAQDPIGNPASEPLVIDNQNGGSGTRERD
jgi:hypothetical protein